MIIGFLAFSGCHENPISGVPRFKPYPLIRPFYR